MKKLLPKIITKKKVAVLSSAAVLFILSLVLHLCEVNTLFGLLIFIAIILPIAIEKGTSIIKKINKTVNNKETYQEEKASVDFTNKTNYMSTQTLQEIAIILVDFAVMYSAIILGTLNISGILPIFIPLVAIALLLVANALRIEDRIIKREKWEAFVASEDEIIIDFILTIKKWYAKEHRLNKETDKIEETGKTTERYFDKKTQQVVMNYIEKNCKPNWPKNVTVNIETAASYILLHKDEVFKTGELKDISFPIINYDADKLVDERVIAWAKKFFNCAPDGEVHNHYLEYMFRLNHSLIFSDQFSCLSVAFEHGHTCDAEWLYDEKIFDVGKIKERMESGGKFLDILKENNISILNGKE